MHKKNNICDDKILINKHKPVCNSFKLDLPFGLQLIYDGDCLYIKGKTTIPDGEYGTIIIKNGNIVDAKKLQPIVYTPPPCSPPPTTCSGSSNTQGTILQPETCNMMTKDSSGRLGAYLVYNAGSGITITGCGTTSSPLSVSLTDTQKNRIYINSGTSDILTVIGNGDLSNPYIISHNINKSGSGNYNGFTFDSYGHFISYTEQPDMGIISIVGGLGIAVAVDKGVATIAMDTEGINQGRWQLGGWVLNTNTRGQVETAERVIDLTPGVYTGEDNIFTVNALGSITDIQAKPRDASDVFITKFSPNRTETTMSFTISKQGYLCIEYDGYLGTYTRSQSEMSLGLIPLNSPYELKVDDSNITIPIYAKVVENRIVGFIATTPSKYMVGDKLITLVNTTPSADAPILFTDNAYMKVTLVENLL